MAVLKAQISTIQQAYAYANESAASASKGVCPSAVGVYHQLAKDTIDGLYGTTTLDKQAFLSDLAIADGVCKAAPDYYKFTGIPTAPTGSTSAAPKVDPNTGGAAPEFVVTPVTAGLGGGLPWWVWVAGGGILYLLLRKKGKK